MGEGGRRASVFGTIHCQCTPCCLLPYWIFNSQNDRQPFGKHTEFIQLIIYEFSFSLKEMWYTHTVPTVELCHPLCRAKWWERERRKSSRKKAAEKKKTKKYGEKSFAANLCFFNEKFLISMKMITMLDAQCLPNGTKRNSKWGHSIPRKQKPINPEWYCVMVIIWRAKDQISTKDF